MHDEFSCSIRIHKTHTAYCSKTHIIFDSLEHTHTHTHSFTQRKTSANICIYIYTNTGKNAGSRHKSLRSSIYLRLRPLCSDTRCVEVCLCRNHHHHRHLVCIEFYLFIHTQTQLHTISHIVVWHTLFRGASTPYIVAISSWLLFCASTSIGTLKQLTKD